MITVYLIHDAEFPDTYEQFSRATARTLLSLGIIKFTHREQIAPNVVARHYTKAD